MILVTGGLGMIGAHTARALVDGGYEVVVTSHRRTEVPPILTGRVTVAPVDLTDRDAVLALGRRHDFTAIVHLAGTIPGDDPLAYFRTDSSALFNALDAARRWGVRRFLTASSIGCYTGRPEVPWHEDLALPAAPLPHLIVALKKAVEPLTVHALHGCGVEPVILRIGSTWGPLMDPESAFNPIPPFINAALRGQRTEPVHADDGGDFCYAPDAGRAIALLATAPSLGHDVYNVSSGRPYTNRELSEAVAAAVPGAAAPLLDGRSGASRNNYLDISRLTAETGFLPAYSVATAVADYVAWRHELLDR